MKPMNKKLQNSWKERLQNWSQKAIQSCSKQGITILITCWNYQRILIKMKGLYQMTAPQFPLLHPVAEGHYLKIHKTNNDGNIYHLDKDWTVTVSYCLVGNYPSINFISEYRAYFNHLLHAIPAHSALFEKWNAIFSTKTSKNRFHLGGCSFLNALNLQKKG